MWWKMRIKLNVKEINKTFTLAVGMCAFFRLMHSQVKYIKYRIKPMAEIFFCLFWKPVFFFVYTLFIVFVCELLIDASLIYHFSKWFCLFFLLFILWIIMFVFKFYYGSTSFNVTTIRKSWVSNKKKEEKRPQQKFKNGRGKKLMLMKWLCNLDELSNTNANHRRKKTIFYWINNKFQRMIISIPCNHFFYFILLSTLKTYEWKKNP